MNIVTNPSRTGYTYNGWNTLTDGSGQIWDFDTDVMPSANLDLYAQWSINQYQLSFNLNGGDGSTPATQAVDFGALATQPSIPQRQGYTFKGWDELEDGTGQAWNFDLNTMPASDVTLYAQWTKQNLPETGGTTNAILFSTGLVLAGVTLVVVNKKRYLK